MRVVIHSASLGTLLYHAFDMALFSTEKQQGNVTNRQNTSPTATTSRTFMTRFSHVRPTRAALPRQIPSDRVQRIGHYRRKYLFT